jgi:hypothetical protein
MITVIVEELLPLRNAAPTRTAPMMSEIVASRPLAPRPSRTLPWVERNSSRLATPRIPNTHNPTPSIAAPMRCTRSSQRPSSGMLDTFFRVRTDVMSVFPSR